MADAVLTWGGDLQIDPTGDIALVAGSDIGQQRIFRRLLTNPRDYIWHAAYGAGLGGFVGRPANQRIIEATIRSQLSLEAFVSPAPPPTVAVQVQPNGQVFADVGYVDSNTSTLQYLSFSLGV